jgi:hypothetical protein
MGEAEGPDNGRGKVKRRDFLKTHCLRICLVILTSGLTAFLLPALGRPVDKQLPESIIISPEAEEVEVYAARELQSYLGKLFDRKTNIISVQAATEINDQNPLILGQPSRSALVKQLTQGVSWEASDQIYALVPAHWGNKTALVVAGASPAAVLWAAYDLIEQWGVRFDLDGDTLPSRPKTPPWINQRITRRPAVSMRVLTGHNLHVEGPASWGLEDYQKFLDQAAKLRYNGYMFMLRDIGPWFDFEFEGIKKQKADIYGGGWQKEYPIQPGLIGYEHFSNEGKIFYNPWFKGAKNDMERMEAGPRLVQAIFEHARRRGMKTGAYFELANLPPEMKESFARLAGASQTYEGIPKEELYLKAKENVANPLLWELIEAKLRAIETTYPNLDFYEIGQMEHTSATTTYLPLWKELDRKYRVSQFVNLEEIFTHADRYPVRRNFRENVAGEIEFLWLIDKIFVDRQALGKIFPKTSQLLIGNGVTTLEFFPILPHIWPPQIKLDAWLEYGYHRAAEKLDFLDGLAKYKAHAWMNNSLDEDNNLWLAQNAIEAIHQTVQKAVAAGVEGMEVGHFRVRDVAPAASYTAEACWDSTLTPAQFYHRYLQDRVGSEAAPTMEKAFRALEQADRYTSMNLIGIAFCFPNRLEPYVDSPESKNINQLRESLRLYSESWKLFAQALKLVTPFGQSFARSWTNRTDFSRQYLEMLLLAHELGITVKRAKVQNGVTAAATELAQRLVRHVRQMVELVARDIQDRSDQGTLISLNYLLYKPALEIQQRVMRNRQK